MERRKAKKQYYKHHCELFVTYHQTSVIFILWMVISLSKFDNNYLELKYRFRKLCFVLISLNIWCLWAFCVPEKQKLFEFFGWTSKDIISAFILQPSFNDIYHHSSFHCFVFWKPFPLSQICFRNIHCMSKKLWRGRKQVSVWFDDIFLYWLVFKIFPCFLDLVEIVKEVKKSNM